MRIQDGMSCNVSTITMSVHCGTHTDAPYHFVESAPKMADVPLEPYIGPCRVVHITPEGSPPRIPASAFDDVQPGERILFRTCEGLDPNTFDEDFCSLGPLRRTRRRREGHPADRPRHPVHGRVHVQDDGEPQAPAKRRRLDPRKPRPPRDPRRPATSSSPSPSSSPAATAAPCARCCGSWHRGATRPQALRWATTLRLLGRLRAAWLALPALRAAAAVLLCAAAEIRRTASPSTPARPSLPARPRPANASPAISPGRPSPRAV
jgi:hypothetical protein